MRLLIRFLLKLTGLRSKEGREARYDEIDFKQKTLTVPGERMKDGKEFRVPLSSAALGLLDAAGPRRKAGLVFPGAEGRTAGRQGAPQGHGRPRGGRDASRDSP